MLRKRRKGRPAWLSPGGPGRMKPGSGYAKARGSPASCSQSFGHWGFPNQSLFKWALLELSADFKSAHAGDNQLAKFKVAKGREWFDDHRDLISEQ